MLHQATVKGDTGVRGGNSLVGDTGYTSKEPPSKMLINTIAEHLSQRYPGVQVLICGEDAIRIEHMGEASFIMWQCIWLKFDGLSIKIASIGSCSQRDKIIGTYHLSDPDAIGKIDAALDGAIYATV